MSQDKKNQQSLKFHDEINNLGRLTSLIALLAMFMVPLGTAFYFGINLNIGEALAASASLIAIFLPMAVAENLSYYPILGAGGMYLSSITGNILNMKLPVVVAGQKIVGVEPGTDEGDVVAIICVGISSLVTITILFLGLFLIGTWLVPILSHPILKPGFDNITPALLGAITVPQLLNQKKLAVTPLLIALSLFFILGPAGFASYQSYILLTVMALSVGVAYLLYQRGKINERGQ